jgi:iron(III) transport system ATP-binding protein
MAIAMSDRAEIQAKDRPAGWGRRGTAGATIAGLLAFESVSRRFGAADAVRDVSFELQPGEIVCLLGPSGCGKTTLLRIAAGIERPSSGRVLIDGAEVAGPSRYVPPEKRNIGLMFQDFALFPHLPIIANVAFGLRDIDRPEAQKIARHALERVGLAHLENAYPHTLSGGEQQRVALARAIVPRPQVMLMDEPFSGLDQRLRESVRSETLALLKETRATTMLVTHDPVEAMELADRILLMRQGRLIQSGAPEELYRRPVDAAAARFFSDFNELGGICKTGAVETSLGRFVAPGLAAGEAALVMIRPQGIRRAYGPIGIEGYCLDSRFLGDRSQCLVLFKGIEEPLMMRVEAAEAPKRGETALFRIDAEHVLVFAKPTAATI